MSEQIKQAKETFKMLCEHIIHDLNRYNKSDIDKDYFYNPKYECGFVTGGKTLYTADILKALEEAEENEKALKIICGKEVGFSQLYYSNNVEDYNNTLYFRFKPSACENMALTQNEFDLVKKVVEKYGR